MASSLSGPNPTITSKSVVTTIFWNVGSPLPVTITNSGQNFLVSEPMTPPTLELTGGSEVNEIDTLVSNVVSEDLKVVGEIKGRFSGIRGKFNYALTHL